MSELVPVERIERKIHLIRGQKVMLDRDLAELYEISTGNLNKAVKRNPDRFPEDFVFQLTWEETALIFQSGISKQKGGIRKAAYAFTEHGVAMLSSVLRCTRAVRVNVQIIRIFIQLRAQQENQKYILNQLNKHETKLIQHEHKLDEVFQVLDDLHPEPDPPKEKKIGFIAGT